jgi:copper/silver efflux system protein
MFSWAPASIAPGSGKRSGLRWVRWAWPRSACRSCSDLSRWHWPARSRWARRSTPGWAIGCRQAGAGRRRWWPLGWWRCWSPISWRTAGCRWARSAGLWRNLLFVALLVGGALLFFRVFQRYYGRLLSWCLDHKSAFLGLIAALLMIGASSWLGFERVFGFIPRTLARIGISEDAIRLNQPWVWARHTFPGLGREFMPALDEGSFLYMPSALPHASLGESLDYLSKQNQLIRAIPEIDTAVGKIGRVESALDPAPVGMVETVIQYKPEFIIDEQGYPLRFRYDAPSGEFARDARGELIPDPDGRPYRQWREEIRGPDDLWNEIVRVAQIPGATGASKLQPIETRRVMLQSGIRARMAVEVKGDDLEVLGDLVLQIEELLRRDEIPGVRWTA